MDKEFDPTTPVITSETKYSKDDPNEVLLDNSEISDDDTADDITSLPDSDLDDIALSNDDEEDDEDDDEEDYYGTDDEED